MDFRSLLVPILLGSIALPGNGSPSPTPKPTPTPGRVSAHYDQMLIVSNRFELDGKKATITFTGKVVVDFRQTHIECQKAIVYSTRQADRILKIVMLGQVSVQQKLGSFRGETVTYYPSTERLLVEGGTQTRIRIERGVPLFE